MGIRNPGWVEAAVQPLSRGNFFISDTESEWN